jgi:hypothetical protein
MLFVLVICVLMLNLVVTNCRAMLYTYREAIHLSGIDRLNGTHHHAVISTGDTHLPIYPTPLFLLSLPTI